MAFADLLDGAIAQLSPSWAASRVAARSHLEAAHSARDGIRQYDAAARDRRTQGWNRAATSADGENAMQRQTVAWAGHDLARNTTFAVKFDQKTAEIPRFRPATAGFFLPE